MIRRRRRSRGIPFSLDSFLDLIANVVGIIIRMILVVWVGAKSYHALMEKTPLPEEPTAPSPPVLVAELPPISDPLEPALQEQRRELEKSQQRLLEQMRLVPALEGQSQHLQGQLAYLQAETERARQQGGQAEKQRLQQGVDVLRVEITLGELRDRGRKIQEDIAALEKMPLPKKELRYRAPVSRPVEADELLFECKKGRVSFIDLEAMINEIKTSNKETVELLRKQWEVQGVTQPLGPFRLRYVIARKKSAFDNPAFPDAQANFSYGLDEWVVEPLTPERGEMLEQALREGSTFRQITDPLQPRQTVVTFCVYGDSFPLCRELCDHLQERDIEVAYRPLPPEATIRGSRRGSVSRGQ